MRGSNENTDGLLRQYFPRGADLSLYTPEDLDVVASSLKGCPRQTPWLGGVIWEAQPVYLSQFIVAMTV